MIGPWCFVPAIFLMVLTGLLYALARAIEPLIRWIDDLGGPPWDEEDSWLQKKWDKEWDERH